MRPTEAASLPSPADYGLDGAFASEAEKRQAWARYEADWHLARALMRDGRLNAAESEAQFAVIAERIYGRAGLSRSDASAASQT